MRKSLIITLINKNNYGNRLQNFALQTFLKNNGFNVETIKYDLEYIDERVKNSLVKKMGNFLSLSMKDKIKSLFDKASYILNKKKLTFIYKKRDNNFAKFNEKFIFTCPYTIKTDDDLTKLRDYDYIFIGSDQVWNPHYIFNSKLFLLDFFTKAKLISFSASYGIDEISELLSNDYRQMLMKLDKISVREASAKKITEKLITKKSIVLLDPTMLVEEKEWIELSKFSTNDYSTKRYAVCYFLGSLSRKKQNEIKKFSKNKNLELIWIRSNKHLENFDMDPSDFLNSFHNAEFILTDSFHGTIFSILFRKQFITYDKEGSYSLFSRISTLLNKFNLNDRKYEKTENLTQLSEINFDHIGNILKQERIKAAEFLSTALI